MDNQDLKETIKRVQFRRVKNTEDFEGLRPGEAFNPSHAAAYLLPHELDVSFHPDNETIVVHPETYNRLVEEGIIEEDKPKSFSIRAAVADEIANITEAKLDSMMMDEIQPVYANRAERRKEARSNRKKGNVRNARR